MKFIMTIFFLATVASSQERMATGKSIVRWSGEPDGFRGLKFGSSETEAIRSFDGIKQCFAMAAEVGRRACTTEFTIDETSVNGGLQFADDHFAVGFFK